jgi:hypothetical protein
MWWCEEKMVTRKWWQGKKTKVMQEIVTMDWQ